MAVVPVPTKHGPQKSDWLTESMPILHQPASNTIKSTNNDFNNPGILER